MTFNYPRISKKAILTLLLMLVFSLLASCSSVDASSSNISNAVKDQTDLSLSLLGQVFGNVPGVLEGSAGQMLGQLFYYLNLGFLMMTGAFLVYTILLATLRAAQEGGFAGQPGKNMIFAALKIAMGIALIIPNASSGYNLAQDVVMKVAVMGIQAADNMWNYGLEYLKAGHAVWVDPGTDQNAGNNVLTTELYKDIMGQAVSDTTKPTTDWNSLQFGEQVYLMETCLLENNGIYSIPIPDQSNKDDPVIQFKGTNNSKAGCGSIHYNKIDVVSSSQGLTDQNWASDADPESQSLTATMSLINSLQPLVQNTVCMKYNNTSASEKETWDAQVHSMSRDCESYQNTTIDDLYNNIDVPTTMSNAYLIYAQNILPIYQAKNATSTSTSSAGAFSGNGTNPNATEADLSAQVGDIDSISKTGELDGWATAGRFFWDLMSLSQALQSIQDFEKYHPNMDENTTVQSLLSSEQSKPYYTKYYQYSDTDQTSFVQQGSDYINMLAINSANADGEGSPTSSDTTSAHVGGIMGALFSPLTLGLSNVIEDFVPNHILVNYSNAFNWLARSGVDMMSSAAEMFLAMGIIILAIYAPAFICAAEQPAGDAAKGVVDWLSPLLMIIIGGLFSAGFMLRYYTCTVPFFIYTCGVISWLVACIEAMIAAPLIGFGVTQPDGHELIGRAEQAIMLLVGLFLRPMLMVISLFASMIVFNVVFKFLLYCWEGFMSDMQPDQFSIKTSGVQAMYDLTTNQITFWLSMMAIFTIMVCHLVVQCFNLISHIPDQILRWIGGPQANSAVTAEKMNQEMQQASRGIGSGVSRGMSATGDWAARQGAEKIGKAYMESNKAKKESDALASKKSKMRTFK